MRPPNEKNGFFEAPSIRYCLRADYRNSEADVKHSILSSDQLSSCDQSTRKVGGTVSRVICRSAATCH